MQGCSLGVRCLNIFYVQRSCDVMRKSWKSSRRLVVGIAMALGCSMASVAFASDVDCGGEKAILSI